VHRLWDSIVTMSHYYATLKADAAYRKRVTWNVACPTVAVFEYQGHVVVM